MLDLLGHWFAAVCGQDPGHSWAPGGILLPCCQRCMGLYVGAGVAALLHLGLRPRLSGRILEIHGAFLLTMVPFGLHWLAQGPLLRSLTGVLFGFGVVTFLWLPLSQMCVKYSGRNQRPSLRTAPVPQSNPEPLRALALRRFHRQRQLTYFLVLAVLLSVLPCAAMMGGTLAAYSLSVLVFWGALALAALVAGNVSLGMLGTLRWLRRLACLHRQS